MKKLLIVSTLLLVFTAQLVLAGGQPEAAKKPAGPVTLKLLWWGGQARHDKTLKVLEMFQEKNPNVKIEPTYLGWGQYWDKLAVFAAAEDLPDIFQMVIERMPQYDENYLNITVFASPQYSGLPKYLHFLLDG